MRDSTAQQKRHAPWLWTKATDTEKGWCMEDVYVLTNMDPPPAEGNFCDDSNHPVKPHIVEWGNQHMGYVANSDHMANSYLMSWHNFKWTMKLFFRLLDLTVLNSWLLLSSCGATYTHWDLRLLLVRNSIEEAGKSQDHPTPRLVGRPSVAITNVVWLDSRHNQHWPAKSSTQLHCRVCSYHRQRKRTVYKCARGDVGLCVVPCFVEYHTQVNWRPQRIVNSVRCDKIVIQGATDLLQQPELCE